MALSLPWLASRDRLASWRTRGVPTLLTPPAVEPVSIEYFRKHSRMPSPSVDDDEVLELKLRAAREWVERYTGRALITQEWTETFAGEFTHAEPILLSIAPVTLITSVTSYDTASAATVMNAATYQADFTSDPARIALVSGNAWPSGLREWASMAVRYTAGYGANGDFVPALLRHAIVVLAGEFSESLEAAGERPRHEMPFGVRALIDSFRTGLADAA